MSELQQIALENEEGVLTLDYKKILHSTELTISELMDIPEENLAMEIESLNLTTLLMQVLTKSLDSPVLEDLVRYPLYALSRKRGCGQKSLEKLLNELSKYSSDIKQIELK